MERALAAEDPKFVSALQGRTLRRVARMRTIAAGVVFVGGVALLRGVSPNDAEATTTAIFEAGIRIIAVPLNSPPPFDSIKISFDYLKQLEF